MKTHIVIDDSPYDLRNLEPRLQEFNSCHDPGSGRFATKGQCGGTDTQAIIGMTSVRPEGDPLHRSNKVVADTMRGLERDLTHLPGVSRVTVKPALGQWDGGEEFSWAVSYDGNGQARRLLAKVAREWNQDAILLIKKTEGARHDAMFEIEFDAVPSPVRRALAPAMGKMLGGWTWFKRAGKTVLRSIAVPQWGGDNRRQGLAVRYLRNLFARNGFRPTNTFMLRGYKAEVLQRATSDGGSSYDDVISGKG